MKNTLLAYGLLGVSPLCLLTAQDATWTGGSGSSTDWSDADNWNPTSVPTGEAQFSLNGTETVTLGSPTNITTVEFSGVGTWVFNGSPLTVLGAPVSSGTRPFAIYNPVNLTFNNAVVFDQSGGSANEHLNFDVNAAGVVNFAGGLRGNSSDPSFSLRSASKLVGGDGVDVTIGSLTDIATFEWRTANSRLTLAGNSSVSSETRINTGFAGDITFRLANDGALGTGQLYVNHSSEAGTAVNLEAVGSDRTYDNDFVSNGGWENGGVGLYTVSGDYDLTFNGTLQLNRSASFNVDADRQLEFGGNTTGGNQIIKEGEGVLVLSGTSIGHTGHTYVNEGTLLVNGQVTAQTTPDIIVTDAAVLGGNGAIARDVVFESGTSGGGVLNPGDPEVDDGIGTLEINGGRSLTLVSDTILAFDLGAAGTHDAIDVASDLVLDGILNINDLGVDTIGDYTLITYGGALTDNGLTLGSGPSGWAYDVLVDEVNKEVVLQVSSIPEPSTAQLLAGLMAIAMVGLRRRRR